MKTVLTFLIAASMALSTVACSEKTGVNASYKDSVEKALEQADLKGVTVDEDKDKNTITLGGALHSEDAKQQATQVAIPAAGPRIVANQISIEPVGLESQARKIESSLDEAIEKNYKAALIAQGMEKQDIDYDAKNGVLTLTGKVKNPQQRQQAEQIASNIPNVSQVLNQIEVKR